jgi:hypothetical protein
MGKALKRGRKKGTSRQKKKNEDNIIGKWESKIVKQM